MTTEQDFCWHPPAKILLKQLGGYSITVSASVCGTDSSGSIPGSRPEEENDYFPVEVVVFDEGCLPSAGFSVKRWRNREAVARIEARLS